jgi:nicotinamide-nucleotide amidase
MNVEIITIGDELLIGQVIDTNSAWMAEHLNLIGLKVHQITSISDSREHILTTLAEAAKRVKIILITGGLGPTKDDITKQTLCEYFDTTLVFHEPSYQNVVKLFRQRGMELNELNRRQAEMPAVCTPIPNPNGTAAGMWFEKDGVIYVSMPGVPFEMKPMMLDEIMPRLAQQFNGAFLIHKTVLTHGVGESTLAGMIEKWENNLPENIKLAYLPQPGIVRLRLSAGGNDKGKLKKEVDNQIKKLRRIIPELVFGYDTETLEEVIGKLLLDRDKTLSTAESCTGGYIAHLITSIPGSSLYFKGSMVAYANEVKIDYLGVPPVDLFKHGAVSREVVSQMAYGAQQRFGTDYAIAVSGIAGPDGGTAEKPVGTTWIGLATPKGVMAREFLFGEHRGRNIRKAALAALNLLRVELLKIKPKPY